LVALKRWARGSALTLVDLRLGHELARGSVKVIPDAWVLLENTKGDQFPILIEIDRGMEYQAAFKRHVKARLNFIRSGEYARVFGAEAVLIAYATTGQTPEYRQTRAVTICAWIREVLEELEMENWAGIFRVTSLVHEEIYTSPLFEAPVWYRPDGDTPVRLLSP
jgi:hypothetical protein